MPADRAGTFVIEPMSAEDWPSVRRIYEEGMATGDATFETEAPEWEAFDAAHRPDCRLVARTRGEIVGWVALSPYSRRPVYRGVAWESVYVAAEFRGRGVGQALLAAVVAASEGAGVWTLLAGVMAGNTASLAVHERAGFRRIGIEERVGGDASGRWRDVILLERRSKRTGLG
jgi:L-amino acid N-acyltransferase YncA